MRVAAGAGVEIYWTETDTGNCCCSRCLSGGTGRNPYFKEGGRSSGSYVMQT